MTTRLAIVRQKYRPDGGAERFISRALEGLSQHDLDLTVITRQWQQNSGESFNVLTCNPPKWGRISREKNFARGVCDIVSREQFDLVQSHERLTCCDIFRAGDGVHRVWLQQRKRILSPLKAKWLELSPYHRYVCEAEQALFESPRLKAVICNSDMVREEIRSTFAIDPSKLHVIYNGINTQTFSLDDRDKHRAELRRRLGLADSTAAAIFVGSGFERKGLAGALHAIAGGPSDTALMVVGSDKQVKHYRQLASQLGIADRVHWLGVQQDVRPFYAAADLLLLPTLYDPFPNVVFEAMACGLPIITSTKCGGAELVSDGVNGKVCDALDYKGLANALNALDSPATCQQWGAASRERVMAYEQKDMIDKLVALYQTLIKNNGTSG